MFRIFLFAITNLAVMVVLYFTMSLLNLDKYMGHGSISGLLVMALITGFGGSIISLMMSKWIAKTTMGVDLINPNNYKNENEKWLYETVSKLADKVNINMPEVGIYEGDANAFATGPSKNNSLVAISTGLYNDMTLDEIEAVLAHEIGHVANGDMVTQTLLQGILNVFVILISRAIGFVLDKIIFKNENNTFYSISVFIFEILLSILASIIVMWFSRYREFRADEMGAKLSSKENMINALKRLGNISTEPLPDKMAGFGISGGKIAKLFSTHPSLEKRIEALEKL